MHVTMAFVVGIGIGQAALQLLQVIKSYRISASSPIRSLAFLLLCVMAYFVEALYSHPILGLLQNFIPAAVWLLCSSVFNDHHRVLFWHKCLIAMSGLLPLIGSLGNLATQPLGLWAFRYLPQLLEFVFLLMALAVVAKHWQTDLIEARRRLRVVFCGLVALYTFMLVFAREMLFGSSEWFNIIQYCTSALILLFTNTLLLPFGNNIFQQVVKPEPHHEDQARDADPIRASTSAVAVPSAELLAGLDTLMHAEHIYRQHGLSIGQLAGRLDEPEYRLRQVINASLGYRNFNDFLNSYRIKEATARLVSQSDSQLPVLTIALDVGFRSLSSFNKAFKDTHGKTPTAYRKHHLS